MKLDSVTFNGAEIPAYRDDDGELWCVLRPIYEALGVDWYTQLKRLRGHPVFEKGLRLIAVEPENRRDNGNPGTLLEHRTGSLTIVAVENLPTTGVKRLQKRQMVAVRVNLLSAALMSIHPNKVSANLRDGVIQFQEECAQVLFEHFMPALAPEKRQDLIDSLSDTDRKVLNCIRELGKASLSKIGMLTGLRAAARRSLWHLTLLGMVTTEEDSRFDDNPTYHAL